MHWRAKYEEEYKSVEHIFQYLYAAKSDERVCGMAEIRDGRTILTRLHGDNFSRWDKGRGRGVAGTKRDGDGLRLDSAASPLGARRGSGDAPFHSQTADIANPFQNISFLNAPSSRWITNLSITSLSRPAFHVARQPRIRHAVSSRRAFR